MIQYAPSYLTFLLFMQKSGGCPLFNAVNKVGTYKNNFSILYMAMQGCALVHEIS